MSVRFYALKGSPRCGGRWRVRCLSSLRERPGGAVLNHRMNAVDACALSRDAAGCCHLVAAGDSDEQVRLVDVDTTDNDARPHTIDVAVRSAASPSPRSAAAAASSPQATQAGRCGFGSCAVDRGGTIPSAHAVAVRRVSPVNFWTY